MASGKSFAQAVSASFIDEAADTTICGLLAVAARDRCVVAAAGQREQAREHEQAPHRRSTITDVALTAAVAATPGRQPELLDRVARHGRRDAERAGLDLDERHHAVDLDGRHDPREAVARRERVAGAMAPRAAAQPRHLGFGDAPAVAVVANGPQLAGAVPAAQRVGADADRLRGVAELQIGHLPKHCIGSTKSASPS